MDTPEARRRSPYWVRALSDTATHALAGKLARDSKYCAEFSSHQSWLLDACISELEYRARRDRRDGIRSCSCEFCCEPFPDYGSPF